MLKIIDTKNNNVTTIAHLEMLLKDGHKVTIVNSENIILHNIQFPKMLRRKLTPHIFLTGCKPKTLEELLECVSNGKTSHIEWFDGNKFHKFV